ncbi:hypothetical protein ACFUN7_28440 [Streptomyces sp. NPDC057236]|uniref:hypothetical protein n=1 Tax=Streptomyces sp. NPDC057236 TaxID=3346059 RepID=UPI003627FD5D
MTHNSAAPAHSECNEPPLFDPFAKGFTDDPYPQYTRIRQSAPVHEHPLGFWVASTYDDVSTLLRSGASVELRNMTGPGTSEQDQTAHAALQPLDSMSMLDRDPPDHTRLRRLVQKAFTPRAISAFEPRSSGAVVRPSSAHRVQPVRTTRWAVRTGAAGVREWCAPNWRGAMEWARVGTVETVPFSLP